MKFSSRTLVKVNFAIFSFVFLGCGGFANSNFIAESRPTAEKCDILNDGGKIINDLIEQIKEKNTNNISFISGKKTNKKFIPDLYIKNYEAKAKTYFSKKNFSLSENFEQEFFDYANNLVANKESNVLFKLICVFVNIVYIVRNNNFLSDNNKETEILKGYNALLKIIDCLVAKKLDLPLLNNNDSIPEVNPNYCLFTCEDLFKNIKTIINDYTCIDNLSYKLPCGKLGEALEQFISPSIDEKGYMTIGESFKIVNDDHDSEGCSFIKNSLKTRLNINSFDKFLQNFDPLITDLRSNILNRAISWTKLLDCLEILKKTEDVLIPFSNNFDKRKNYSYCNISIKTTQTIFDKRDVNDDVYKYVIKESIINNEDFKKVNDSLKNVFGISQKDVLDIICEFLELKTIYSWETTPIICNFDDFNEKVKEKRK